MSGKKSRRRKDRPSRLHEADGADATIERVAKRIARSEGLSLRDARKVPWFSGLASQMSEETGISEEETMDSLARLHEQGLIELKPDTESVSVKLPENRGSNE